MTQTVRSLALAAAGALLLSACGALNALIPDQTVDEGVLGIGSAGVDVTLEADLGPAGIGAAQVVTATVFSGTLDVASVDVDAIDELPDFVEAAAITETVSLGNSVVVTYPTSAPADTLTLAELELAGSVTISGTEYTFPVLTADGLAVVFANPDCTDGVCTYTTASNLPEIDVALAAAAVDAYSALLQGGGTIGVEVTVTATLATGIAADAQIVVTLESLGAVIEF